MKIKTSKPRNKRPIIIITLSIIGVALIAYGIFSYLYWKEYDQNANQAPTSLKSSIDESLGVERETAVTPADITSIVDDFKNTYGDNPCQIPTWFAWQTVIPTLKDKETACNQGVEASLTTISSLESISQFITDEQKTADLFSSTLEVTKAPTDYTAASTQWKDLSQSTELPTNESFAVVKSKAVEVATSVSNAYGLLASANSAQSKANFDSAITALNASYGGIDQLKTTGIAEQAKLIDTFMVSYREL